MTDKNRVHADAVHADAVHADAVRAFFYTLCELIMVGYYRSAAHGKFCKLQQQFVVISNIIYIYITTKFNCYCSLFNAVSLAVTMSH